MGSTPTPTAIGKPMRCTTWDCCGGKTVEEVLQWMDHTTFPMLSIPARGMAFAVGNMAKRPQTWQLLGVIRLDELPEHIPPRARSLNVGLGRERQCALRRSNHAPFLDSSRLSRLCGQTVPAWGGLPPPARLWPHLRAGMKRQKPQRLTRRRPGRLDATRPDGKQRKAKKCSQS